jgi:hypothetical protein
MAGFSAGFDGVPGAFLGGEENRKVCWRCVGVDLRGFIYENGDWVLEDV